MAPPRNRRPGFSRRAQHSIFWGYVAAGVAAAIAAALLLLSTFNPAAYGVLRGGVAELTTPLSSGLNWVRRSFSGIPSGISAYFGVYSENQALRQRVAAEAKLVERARAVIEENRHLHAILHVRERGITTVAIARLVNSSASSTRRFATLNAGSSQGVRPAQPVRSGAGLIGQIVSTSPNTARVLLIIDPDSVIPVRRARDGVAAIAAGRGDGRLEIRAASVGNVALNAGDLFVTSGTGGIFPPNIPVAQVLRSARDTALARPLAGADTLDFAMVLESYLPPAPPPPGAEHEGENAQ